MQIYAREVEISQNGQNGKLEKVKVWLWLNGQMTIFPLTKINENIQKYH